MTVSIPANSRGPILDLTLPASTPAIDFVVRNVTTGKRLVLNLPAGFAGDDLDDLSLDFFRRTITDQDGNDRSSLLSPVDNGLWVPDPMVAGVNDIEISVEGPVAAEDTFLQGAGNLGGEELPVGGIWLAEPSFQVDAVLDAIKRVGPNEDNLDNGRHALASAPNLTSLFAEVAPWVLADPVDGMSSGPFFRSGLVVRYTDINRWLMLVREWHATGSQVRLLKRAGETISPVGGPVVNPFGFAVPFFVGLSVDAAGEWEVYIRGLDSEYADPVAAGTDTDFATGGALANGMVGIYGSQIALTVGTPMWDSFKVIDRAPASYGATATLRWEKGYF